MSLVYRGNRGPLDTASGLLGALNRAVGRSQPGGGGRARSGGQSVLPTGLPPVLSSLFSYCVSLHSPLSPFLPPSAPQRSCANPTIGTVARGRNRFQLRGRTDADGRSDGRRERLVHWSSEQASQVFTASAVDQSSFSPSPPLSP